MNCFLRLSAVCVLAASNWLAAPACHAAGLSAVAKPAQLDDAQWASLQTAVDANLVGLMQFEGDVATAGADGAPQDEAGFSVALDGDTALIGVPFDDVGNAIDQGSVHVFKRVADDWQYEAKLVALEGASADRFGYSVDLDGDTAIVGGLFREPEAGNRIGVAHVFVRTGGAWIQQQRLTTSFIHALSRVETSVAVSGDIALVGVPHETVGTSVLQGAAYVFVRVGSSWFQQGPMLVASDGVQGSSFGSSVDLVGTTAIVGAWGQQLGENFAPGAAYVFTRGASAWLQQARLTASNGANGDQFGYSVAVHGDTALVGAPNRAVSGSEGLGTAYVFRKSGTLWSEQAQLTGSGTEAAVEFGHSVALEAGIAAVGAPATLGRAGRTYVFADAEGSWSQQASYAVAPLGEFGSALGASVALDGGSLLAGAPSREVDGNQRQGAAFFVTNAATVGAVPERLPLAGSSAIKGFGYSVDTHNGTALVSASMGFIGSVASPSAVYVYTYEGSQWRLQARLQSPDPSMSDGYGASVAVFGDLALVGAPYATVGGVAERGAVYVYRRTGSTWAPEGTLTSDDGASLDGFGAALDLHGLSAVVGASGHDVGGNLNQGAAYVFIRDGQQWSRQAKLTASDGAAQDRFGGAVAIHADTVLIGAADAIYAAGFYRGVAYLFDRTGAVWSQSARLTPDPDSMGGGFGRAVALDAETAVIGGATEQAQPDLENAVYVFSRAGSSWERLARLQSGQSFFDGFGTSVAVDMDSLLVAASERGLVYLFKRQQGVWSLYSALADLAGRPGDRFGNAVSVSGGFALIGAFGTGGNLPFGNPQDGGAYVFSGLADLFANGFESSATTASVHTEGNSPR